MRAEELDHGGKSIETPPQPAAGNEHAMLERAGPDSFGQRLRAAREAKGLTRTELAQSLKLPLRLIGRLEDDNYSGIDQGVYLRGYLSSYARAVGIPTVAAETVAAANIRSAPLVATGQVSRSRYLFDRYSVSATYLILTGLIVLPAVWLATHGGLEQNLARTTPLDGPTTTISLPATPPSAADDVGDANREAATQSASTAADTAASSAATDLAKTEAAKTETAKPEQMPVIASMAPFTSPASAAPVPEASSAHAATGAHALVLRLKAASWVEIVAADGSKLEYGILPGGVEKTYSSDGPLSVRLGNAEGAEVDLDGKPLDLAPFRHANVARLRVFGADGAAAQPSEF